MLRWVRYLPVISLLYFEKLAMIRVNGNPERRSDVLLQNELCGQAWPDVKEHGPRITSPKPDTTATQSGRVIGGPPAPLHA